MIFLRKPNWIARRLRNVYRSISPKQANQRSASGRSDSPLLTDLSGKSILGSSLSSGAARMRSRVRHEAPEDGIADTPLEAPQRFLTGFALRHLLAVVTPAANVRPALAYRDHVQGVVELTIPGQ